jgi:hypothetical protein
MESELHSVAVLAQHKVMLRPPRNSDFDFLHFCYESAFFLSLIYKEKI